MATPIDDRIADAARRLQVTPGFLLKLLLVLLDCSRRGIPTQVVSMYRSPEYQRSLRERWDRGDRAGLTVRPAATSRHSSGKAADVTHGGRHAEFGEIVERHGLKWGGRFSTPDWNHVEDW